MKHNHFFKKSALTAAIVCSVVSISAQAEEVNQSTNQSVSAAFAPGTQSRAEAELQEQGKTDDDRKLSPNLFRLKEYAKQKNGLQNRASNRIRSAVVPSSPITLDIMINGSVDEVQGELDAVGFNVDAVYGNSIGGTISPDNLEALSQIPAVRRINMPEKMTHAGIVQNQADVVHYSKKIKESLKNAPTGKGITIGILSDSFDCASNKDSRMKITAATDVKNGELPGDVNVVKDDFVCWSQGDEGRAMAQLVHDIAPDAKIAFYSPDSITDFAEGIQLLALPKGQRGRGTRVGAGANIIVDDLYYYNEPYYESGIIGDSISRVVKNGVAYFVSAGNFTVADSAGKKDVTIYATDSAQFVPFTPDQNSPMSLSNAQVLKINDGPNGTVLPVKVSSKNRFDFQYMGVWWGQSYAKGSQSKIMVCLTKPDGTAISQASWCDTQQIGQNPNIQLSFSIGKVSSGEDYGLQLFYLEGVKPTSFTVSGLGQVAIDPSEAAERGSIFGHATTPAAFTLGAADFAQTPQCNAALSEAQMESFSSYGNSPLLFDVLGNAINIVPNKPDATAVDGVSTSFFGRLSSPTGEPPVYRDAACNLTSNYRFYGTSAAAPNAAAIAALIVQDNPGITPEEIYNALRQSATPIGKTPAEGKYNYVSGYGLINAEKAINTLRAGQKD